MSPVEFIIEWLWNAVHALYLLLRVWKAAEILTAVSELLNDALLRLTSAHRRARRRANNERRRRRQPITIR
jgi:hypothetical protein